MRKYFFLPFLVLFGGCGSDDDPGLTRASFCSRWAKAACTEQTVDACQASDAAACQNAQEDFCLDLVVGEFVDDQADACLTAVGRAYRDANLTNDELRAVLRLGPPCDRLLRGPKDAGESCSQDRDCDTPGGYKCVRKGDAAMGACEIPEEVGAGRSCEAAQQVCVEGFYCNGDNCIEYEDPGSPCTNQDQCGTTGYCGAEGTCVARLGVNAACTSDIECESGVCFTFGDGDQVCIETLRLSRSENHCDTLR